MSVRLPGKACSANLDVLKDILGGRSVKHRVALEVGTHVSSRAKSLTIWDAFLLRAFDRSGWRRSFW